MMNEHVISLAESFQNPFKLKHIKSITAAQYDQLTGPCVVMASPGFLQSGMFVYVPTWYAFTYIYYVFILHTYPSIKHIHIPYAI
ncbi:hypothetical protein EON63_19560 [archaeon]|nr:MAG: hypothetical protein EON63_19560 [archaeon]